MKTIPKKLELLAKEARKYKTAEEFEKTILTPLLKKEKEGAKKLPHDIHIATKSVQYKASGRIDKLVELDMAINYLKGENPPDLLVIHHPRWTEKIPMKGLKIKKAGFKDLKSFWKVATQKSKTQGLTRTWNSKTKQWNYKYTKRTKKTKKKQPDIKLSQHDKLLLAGKYKIRDKPKTVRNFGNVVTGGLKKTNKTTKTKAKRKKRRKVKSKAQQRTLFEGVVKYGKRINHKRNKRKGKKFPERNHFE